jgi:hypothetical protein
MEISGHFHAPSALTPNKVLPIPTEKEGGWALEPVWIFFTEEESVVPAGNRTTNFRLLIPLNLDILT